MQWTKAMRRSPLPFPSFIRVCYFILFYFCLRELHLVLLLIVLCCLHPFSPLCQIGFLLQGINKGSSPWTWFAIPIGRINVRFCKTQDMLKLSFGSSSYFMSWQRCANALIWLKHKKNMVRLLKGSCFGVRDSVAVKVWYCDGLAVTLWYISYIFECIRVWQKHKLLAFYPGYCFWVK